MNRKVLILITIIILGILSIIWMANNDNLPAQPSPAISTSTDVSIPNNENVARIETKIDQGGSALDVKIVPVELLEDSRCPINAVCIQAGTVRVRAMLTSGLGTANQVFVLNQPITTEAEEVTLIDVEPKIIDPGEISPNQYRFIFEIKKRFLNSN